MRTYLLALCALLSLQANPFDLKGYALGQPMTECPQGSTVFGPANQPVVSCDLGPTTVANQPVSRLVVAFFEGKVVTIFAGLTQSGQYSNTEVRDALIEKFGEPNSSLTKRHLNEYRWRGNGGQLMSLDGWKGNLIIQDLDAHRRARSVSAGSNKSDL